MKSRVCGVGEVGRLYIVPRGKTGSMAIHHEFPARLTS